MESSTKFAIGIGVVLATVGGISLYNKSAYNKITDAEYESTASVLFAKGMQNGKLVDLREAYYYMKRYRPNDIRISQVAARLAGLGYVL